MPPAAGHGGPAHAFQQHLRACCSCAGVYVQVTYGTASSATKPADAPPTGALATPRTAVGGHPPLHWGRPGTTAWLCALPFLLFPILSGFECLVCPRHALLPDLSAYTVCPRPCKWPPLPFTPCRQALRAVPGGLLPSKAACILTLLVQCFSAVASEFSQRAACNPSLSGMASLLNAFLPYAPAPTRFPANKFNIPSARAHHDTSLAAHLSACRSRTGGTGTAGGGGRRHQRRQPGGSLPTSLPAPHKCS